MARSLPLLLLPLLASCKGSTSELPSTEGPNLPYKAPAEGTIKDPSTHLYWQRCAWGQSGKDCEGVPENVYAEVAADRCGSLQLAGYSWRLPTAEELLTLVVCPDGNPPTLEGGCAEPHYNACYNPVWFPAEGENARYWSSEALDGDLQRALSLNDGKAGTLSLIRDQARVRCVSDGRPFQAGTPVPERDPSLSQVRIVARPGAPLWVEASISAESVGSLVAGQLVSAGDTGPAVTWQGREAHFVKVQGLPWSGWTVDALLEVVPPSGVLEAIDAAFVTPPGVPVGAAAMGVLPERQRLVPGQQYRLVSVGAGKVTVVMQGSPSVVLGETDASSFRWVEPQEFVCTRRIAALGTLPPGLEALWPRDAQACEHYEAKKLEPIFPNSVEVWRLHGEKGGFEGYYVDQKAIETDGRPAEILATNTYVIADDSSLKVLGFRVQAVDLLLEKRWDPKDPNAVKWTVASDGRLTGSDGSLCRLVEQKMECTHD